MATYKVIQDIEAEDKLLGPFTLRQFVYVIIVIVCLFMGFQFGRIQPLIAIIFIPPAAFFALLAAPFGHDQSSEVWLLAKIRFSLKPRRRIWDQTGMQELVTITAPKKVEHNLTDGLNQYEVKSRLSALANTLDSRGWAVKNVNVNMFSPPSYLLGQQASSDRLINPSSLPQDVPGYGNTQFDDVLDENTSPTAQHFNKMVGQSQQSQKQRIMDEMHQSGGNPKTVQPADYWFMNQPPQPTDPSTAAFTKVSVVAPGNNQPKNSAVPTPEEQAILDKFHAQADNPSPAYGHMRTIEPLGSKRSHKKPAKQAEKPPASPMTPAPDPAIMQLANNDDLNVATIARQANKVRPTKSSPDEVVISLH